MNAAGFELELRDGEEWGDLFAVMLFPEDAQKRRAWTAQEWLRVYPDLRDSGGVAPVDELTLLDKLREAKLSDGARDEWDRHWIDGMLAGDMLKALMAIASNAPHLASWSQAIKVVQDAVRAGGRTISDRELYRIKESHGSVCHFWAAWILRGQRIYESAGAAYSVTDDLNIFMAEAMALLQWATNFTLPKVDGTPRAKAEPTLNAQSCWVCPRTWEPPIAKPGWLRDGRVAAFTLEPQMARRVGKARTAQK